MFARMPGWTFQDLVVVESVHEVGGTFHGRIRINLTLRQFEMVHSTRVIVIRISDKHNEGAVKMERVSELSSVVVALRWTA
jgi:hypothetical protein